MALRSVLLFLSRQTRLRRWMETSPLAGRLTRRFIAGQTLERGITVGRRLNSEGILVTLDHLGENVTSEAEAAVSRDAYVEALRRIQACGLNASVSIKLTQFGLDLSETLCRSNIDSLVATANDLGGFVEIDMESHEYIDRTLKLVTEMHRRYGRVRGVIQAYLRRSEADALRLCESGVPVRLCKGAYREPVAIVFPRKSDVDANYMRLTRMLLERGAYPAMATHDPNMVEQTLRFALEMGIGQERFEFQMLYGIRRDLQSRLIKDGYRLRLYVPYGDAWYPYFMRRLAERPANVLFILRNLFRK